jgi:hypothetical protein
MRTLRRLFQRLLSWATSAQDEELLRAEIEEHIAMQTAENFELAFRSSRLAGKRC